MSERGKLPHELDPDYMRQRDRNEKLIVASLYLDTVRCVGGHIVHRGYVCPHCNSTEPSEECHMTKVTRDELRAEQEAAMNAFERKKKQQKLAVLGVNEIH